MRVEGCALADTKGARRCPSCGERHLQKVHSCDSTGRPVKVECPVCRHVWAWPTVAEDERRRKEQMRERSHEHYLAHKEEIQAYERANRERRYRLRRERYAVTHRHLHPVKRCPVCGSTFTSKHPNHTYCSRECANVRTPDKKRKASVSKALTRRRKAAYLAALERVASECGRLDECREIRRMTR